MKRTAATALFTMVSLLTLGNAFGQARKVQATVPFSFTVGDKLLPSGTYLISSQSPSIIRIEDRQQNVAMFTMARADDKSPSKGNKLVFNKYGDQYFLHEILCDTANMNLELPATKIEQRVRTEEARLRNSSQTTIALK